MHYTRKSYIVTLPLGVEMTVNMAKSSAASFIDLVLTMHQEPEGQRGHCGNFNGNQNDDTKAMMGGASMRSQGRLLSSIDDAIPEESAGEGEVDADVCTAAERANATAVCTALCDVGPQKALAASFIEGCVYDVCRGGEELAVSDCLTAWQTQTALDPTSTATAVSGVTSLIGEGCCKPWREILENTPNLSRSECAIQCASNARCNAFAISGCSSSSDETCGGQCHLYRMGDNEDEAHSGACFEMQV